MCLVTGGCICRTMEFFTSLQLFVCIVWVLLWWGWDCEYVFFALLREKIMLPKPNVKHSRRTGQESRAGRPPDAHGVHGARG